MAHSERDISRRSYATHGELVSPLPCARRMRSSGPRLRWRKTRRSLEFFFRRPQSGYAGLSLAVRVEGDPAPVGHRQAAKGSVSPAVRVRSLSNGREEPSVEPDSMPCRTRELYTQRTMPSREFASAPVLAGFAPWLLDYRPL